MSTAIALVIQRHIPHADGELPGCVCGSTPRHIAHQAGADAVHWLECPGCRAATPRGPSLEVACRVFSAIGQAYRGATVASPRRLRRAA